MVVLFDPFQRTREVATKLLPLTVSVKAAPPARAAAGLRLTVIGAWLPPGVIVIATAATFESALPSLT